jgi:hypothetical protein
MAMSTSCSLDLSLRALRTLSSSMTSGGTSTYSSPTFLLEDTARFLTSLGAPNSNES